MHLTQNRWVGWYVGACLRSEGAPRPTTWVPVGVVGGEENHTERTEYLSHYIQLAVSEDRDERKKCFVVGKNRTEERSRDSGHF